MSGQEQDNIVQKKEYVCPRCGMNLDDLFIQWLNQLSGMKNGDLKELGWKLRIAETTLNMAGIRVTESEISEKVLQRMEGLLSKKLSEDERQRYEDELSHKDEIIKELERSRRDLAESEIGKLNEKIKGLEELKQQKDRDYERLEREYSELKSKMHHNPSYIGHGAEVTLQEDLDTNFPIQKFENVAETKKHGDLLVDLRTETESGWMHTGLKLVIDSKDKEKVTQSDVDKICNDMEFWNSEIGLLISVDEDQLRLKDRPCSMTTTEKGLLIITSKTNEYHHLVLRLLEMFARQKYLQKINTTVFKELVQNKVLYNKISSLFTYKTYIEKIKECVGKTEKIVKELDEFLEPRFKEIMDMITSLAQGKSGEMKVLNS